MSFFVFMSVALAATWPYRAPVPATVPSDGQGFSVCLEVGADLSFDGASHTDGNVSWTCESQPNLSRVCYEVSPEGWPTKWPMLTCAGPETTIAVNLIEAFDPADDLSKGARVSGRVDESVGVFVVGDRFVPQQVEGSRGARCVVTEGRLYVSRETASRRRDFCPLRVRGGAIERLKIRSSGSF